MSSPINLHSIFASSASGKRRLPVVVAGLTAITVLGVGAFVTTGGSQQAVTFKPASANKVELSTSTTTAAVAPTAETTIPATTVVTPAKPAVTKSTKAPTTTVAQVKEVGADYYCEIGPSACALPTGAELYKQAAFATTMEDGEYFAGLGVSQDGSLAMDYSTKGELRWLKDTINNKTVAVFKSPNGVVTDMLILDTPDASQRWTAGVVNVVGGFSYKGQADESIFMLATWSNSELVSIDRAWKADLASGKIVELDTADIIKVEAAA